MKMLRLSLTLLVLLPTAAWFTGCSKNSPTMSHDETPLVRTVPASGEMNYDPSAPIHMRFNEPVDTSGFHERFLCVDSMVYQALHDSLMMGGMGMGMGNHHSDSIQYYDRMHERRVHGEFVWNDRLDSCDFTPNLPLTRGHGFMMMFSDSLQNRDGDPMRDMGEAMMQDLVMYFRTR